MNDKIFRSIDGFAVDALFLKSLPRDLRTDHLFDYFSPFGPLHSVRIHAHASHSFGFVKFQAVEAAAAALKLRHHAIDGRQIEVEIAERCHQDESVANDEVPIELMNATGTEFMDVSDDCLGEILARVSVMDLCSLLELANNIKNYRLGKIVNELFVQKYKRYTTDVHDDPATRLDDIERLLANFGSHIKNLSTDGRCDNDEDDDIIKMKSIVRWCSGTLTELNVMNYLLHKEDVDAMKPMFGNLKKLSIVSCWFHDSDWDIFPSCKLLESLTIVCHVPINESIYRYSFNDLNMLCNGSRYYDPKRKSVNFASIHKKLTLLGWHTFDHSNLLPMIARNCSGLRELTICTNGDVDPRRYETYVKSIAALQSLQRLRICRDSNALKFIVELNHLQSLRELYLLCVDSVPGIVTALSKLQALEVLFLFKCKNFTNLNRMAELRPLKKLYVLSVESVYVDLAYLVGRLVHLDTFVIRLRQRYTIDKNIYSKIANARSKGGAECNLKIVCNEVTTEFSRW